MITPRFNWKKTGTLYTCFNNGVVVGTVSAVGLTFTSMSAFTTGKYKDRNTIREAKADVEQAFTKWLRRVVKKSYDPDMFEYKKWLKDNNK